MGERHVRNVEVVGSIPTPSTITLLFGPPKVADRPTSLVVKLHDN